MARIHCAPVREISTELLLREFFSIPCVINSLYRSLNTRDYFYVNIPKEYTTQRGNMKFFYNKLLFLTNRYKDIYIELQKRNCKNIKPKTEWIKKIEFLLDKRKIPDNWIKDWSPDKNAIDKSVWYLNNRMINKQGDNHEML